ncbi:MAG: hypothetical protein CMM50_11360 [Rhodospirillaceae bacterium]|nr:hypothetical protein [Rhodospirillaceae bacterium]
MAFADSKGGKIHFRVIDLTPPWATAPDTIIFQHGLGIDSDIWSGWFGTLAGRYRIVLADLRGFGQSSVPADDHVYSWDELMDDILAVADAVGAERFHFVGESIGGTLGLALAINHPDRLLTLTAASTAHRGGSVQHVTEWRAFIAKRGMEQWSAVMMDRRFWPDALPTPVYAWFHDVQARSPLEPLLGLAHMLVETDFTGDLPRIATPTFLLAADRSPFVPLTVSTEIHHGVPGCEMQVVPRARHGVVCSHAAICAEAVRGFLGRHARHTI